METARFQGGQVRMAGSLETSGRQYARNKRIEIERETSSFYDELFAPTPSSAAANQQQKQQTKNKISPSNNRLYKSTHDFHADTSSDEMSRSIDRRSSPRRVPNNLRREPSRDSDLESSGFRKNRHPSPRKNFNFTNETRTSKTLSNRTNSSDLITARSTNDYNKAANRSPDRSTTRNSSPVLQRSDDEDNRSRRKSISKRDMSSKLSKKRDSVVRPRSNVRSTNENDDDDDLEEPLPPNDFSLTYFREVNDLEFLFKPAPRGLLIQTCIRVQANMMSADEYEVIFEDFADRRSPLLKSQSKTAAGVSYSVNALTPNGGGSSKKIGKVESTFSKKKYTMSVIDLGDGSRESDYEDKPSSSEVFELIYSNRVIADDKPKDIKVKLMETSSSSRRGDSRDSGNANMLVSKKPKLDEKTKLFQLDFRGRARFASTSNMQLVLSGDVDNDSAPVVFQLGKLDKHLFAMDFSYPLSMVTAFGIALSALSRG